MLCKSTSVVWLQRGYWPCKGFEFQAVLIALFPFSLAVLFNFQAFSVFFISPSNSVQNLNLLHPQILELLLQQSMNLFLFHVLKLVAASSHLINSSIKKDQLWCFIRQLELRQTSPPPLPHYSLKGKDGEYHPLGDGCCVLSSSF